LVQVPLTLDEKRVKIEARFDSGPLAGELTSSADIEVRETDR
jgi:hypothetical protein